MGMPEAAGRFDEAHETFRDALTSVDREGRRKWVYARQPSGRFYRARTLVSWVLLAFFLLAPFVRVHGQPLLLFNILERKFVLFGLVFWPQDFYLLVLCVLTGFVTIALATSAVGRVWCGWLCPQTVFLEMLFRKIEFAIEGSAEQQLRRARTPMSSGTAWRKGLKHVIYGALSFGIANVFLAYVIGSEALWTIVTDPPREHLAGLLAITVFSALFYAVFARFREQACTLACPYGRVMGALVDRHSVTVTYDWRRGEPRGRLVRGASRDDRGDCVDCGQCVTVCPTGIDIRNGIQLECVACTACIDACDDVMRRVQRPAGLIRYASEQAIRTGRASWLTPRVKAYALVWLVLAGTTTTLIARRPDLDVLVLRQPGTLQATLDAGGVGNFYTVQVINRTSRRQTLTYRARTPAGASLTSLGAPTEVPPSGMVEGRLLVRLPAEAVSGGSTPVQIDVLADGTLASTATTSFLSISRDMP